MDFIQDEIRDQILASARMLTERKNTGKITVRDILTDMQVSNRVFYNRFHNIDEVLELLYEESISRVRDSILVPWDEGVDFWGYIMEIASRTLILSYESRLHISQFVFEADSSNKDNFTWWNREIVKLIQKGKKEHLVREDLQEEAMSYSIWCFIRGFNADALARQLPREEALAQFQLGFDCFLRGMRG